MFGLFSASDRWTRLIQHTSLKKWVLSARFCLVCPEVLTRSRHRSPGSQVRLTSILPRFGCNLWHLIDRRTFFCTPRINRHPRVWHVSRLDVLWRMSNGGTPSTCNTKHLETSELLVAHVPRRQSGTCSSGGTQAKAVRQASTSSNGSTICLRHRWTIARCDGVRLNGNVVVVVVPNVVFRGDRQSQNIFKGRKEMGCTGAQTNPAAFLPRKMEEEDDHDKEVGVCIPRSVTFSGFALRPLLRT